MTSPFDSDPRVVQDEGLRVFGGYIEPDDARFSESLTARDLMLDRLLRARSRDAQRALATEAAVHGLVVEDPDDGGEAP